MAKIGGFGARMPLEMIEQFTQTRHGETHRGVSGAVVHVDRVAVLAEDPATREDHIRDISRALVDRGGAEHPLVVKSGYFARSGPAGPEDRALINRCATMALRAGLDGCSGVVGQDDTRGAELGVIEFARVRGGRPLDTSAAWVRELPLALR